MKWQPIKTPADEASALHLLQRPMPTGRFQVTYALASFAAPESCRDLQGVLVHVNEVPAAVALRWRWPDGTPYLAGLRSALPTPAGRRRWTECFTHLLGDEGWAMTTIGRSNAAARRVLMAQVPGWPVYRPVQGLVSWVLPPLGARGSAFARKQSSRHFAVHGGGLAGHTARLVAKIGLWRGLVPDGRPIPLALPAGIRDLHTLRDVRERAAGCWVGLTLPDGHPLDAQLAHRAPRGAQRFESDLFTVALPRNPVPQKKLWDVEAAWL